MELNWIGKTRTGNQSAFDVAFSFQKTNSGSQRIMIRFSASAVSIKFKGAEHLVFAISGTRVYFKEADSRYGYKLSKHNAGDNTSRTIALINDDLADFLHKHPHIMNTNLKFDATQELYFVDASDRQLDWKENKG